MPPCVRSNATPDRVPKQLPATSPSTIRLDGGVRRDVMGHLAAALRGDQRVLRRPVPVAESTTCLDDEGHILMPGNPE